jgi:hypothetical protein
MRTLAQATAVSSVTMSDDIYITVSLEEAEDQPVADILYRGVQWASLRLDGDVAVLSVYATEDGFVVPLAAALDSLDEAHRRLH